MPSQFQALVKLCRVAVKKTVNTEKQKIQVELTANRENISYLQDVENAGVRRDSLYQGYDANHIHIEKEELDELQTDIDDIIIAEFTFNKDAVSLYEDFSDFWQSESSITRGIFPDEFYLAEEDLYYPEQENEKIKHVQNVCTFISSLITLAHYHDKKRTQSDNLVFLPRNVASSEPIVLEVMIDAEILETKLDDISILTNLLDERAHLNLHHVANKSIFYSSLREFIHNEAPKQAFITLATQWERFSETYQNNLSVYLSEFSYHKIEKEMLKDQDGFLNQISSVLNEISGKLFSIPVSFIGVFTLLANKNNGWEMDVILFIGMLIATVITFGIVQTQRDTFNAIDAISDSTFSSFSVSDERKNDARFNTLNQTMKTAKEKVRKKIANTKCWLNIYTVLAIVPSALAGLFLLWKYYSALSGWWA